MCYPSAGSTGGPGSERREFITLLGGAAAAWPLAARAQQPAMPAGRGPQQRVNLNPFTHFRGAHSIKDWVKQGRNVTIEYRWAEDETIVCRRWRPMSPSSSHGDRGDRRKSFGTGGKSGDRNHSNRLDTAMTRESRRRQAETDPAATSRA